jgi:EAL domain-containing protein (putative c-di-GMP-specific phosphodiesterase class I)
MVSPSQFHNLSLLNQLRSLAATPDFDPGLMEIELTETALQIGESHFNKMLQEIFEMGYTLAIDDFGSAYSNIARLNGYPVNTIKIDRSMMTHADGKLVSGAIDIVRALNLSVVAEGVETQEQSEWLVSKGCTEHQGFFYSRPLSLEQVKLIQTNDISSLAQFNNT